MNELLEILKNSTEPWIEIQELYDNGKLKLICPELNDLSYTEDGHKNNFLHTMKVLKNVCYNNYSYDMKVVALFHDIGKPYTKVKTVNKWTFHNHEAYGANLFLKICKKYNIIDLNIDYVYKMILYHGRIKMHRDVSDSAIRRLITELGYDFVFDVINFSKCDLTTTKNEYYDRFTSAYNVIYKRCIEVHDLDEYNNWKSPLTGYIIMDIFNNNIDGKRIGEIKNKYDKVLRNNEMSLDDVIAEIKKEE